MRALGWLFAGWILGAPAFAFAADTATCAGKRAWQREVVHEIVHAWFLSQPSAEGLLQLIQAEQGLAACATSDRSGLRLHTTTLPSGLELDQLGAILLANELGWIGALPAPEQGLAGQWFHVRPNGSDAGVGE